jgi:hypothetical protein
MLKGGSRRIAGLARNWHEVVASQAAMQLSLVAKYPCSVSMRTAPALYIVLLLRKRLGAPDLVWCCFSAGAQVDASQLYVWNIRTLTRRAKFVSVADRIVPATTLYRKIN